ncbi:type II TA system antitoxin MqsA family protein [Planctomycetota bacterium]
MMTNQNEEVRQDICPNCEDYCEVVLKRRDESYTVRGEEIILSVENTICSQCGEPIGKDEQDQGILDAIHAEYRHRADLLTPVRIKEIRKRYQLSQKSFSALLGMSEATVNRYEKGGLQDQTHDTAIRACERPEVMRDLLTRRGHLLTDWQLKRAEQALEGQTEKADAWLDLIGEVDWICMPRGVSVETGNRRFDYHRFAFVVTWFCQTLERVSRTTINKLLFYTDFLNYKTSTVSLTGTAYRRLAYGPVPADYGGLLSRMESEELLVSEEQEYPNGYIGFYYSPGPRVDSLNTELTDYEKAVLQHVAETFGGLTANDISSRSHQELAWKDTEDRQLIPYDHATSLSISLPE